MIPGACYLIYDADNGEPHQIKTNQAKKENWLAVLSLAQLRPSLLIIFFKQVKDATTVITPDKHS